MKAKKVFSAAAAAAVAVSAMSVSASAAEYDAFLMFTDYDWAWGNWETGTDGDTTVDGPGTYTVSVDASAVGAESAANGAQVFCVDIVDAAEELAGYDVTLDSIKADGNEVEFDAAKINYGDIEEKGTFRIEIFNVYGETGKSDSDKYMPIDSAAFSAAENIEVTFTVSGGEDALSDEEESEEDLWDEDILYEGEEEEDIDGEEYEEEYEEEDIAHEPVSGDEEYCIENGELLGADRESDGWGQALTRYTYNNADEVEGDAFDSDLISEDNVIVVFYESDSEPELILQSWSGGNGWAKVPANPDYSKPGMAVFTYDYMIAMYGEEDMSLLDAVNIGDTGNHLTLYSAFVVDAEAFTGAPAETEEAPAETEAPAPADTAEAAPAPAAEPAASPAPSGDSASAPVSTGNIPAAAFAGIMAAAAGAVLALKKRK